MPRLRRWEKRGSRRDFFQPRGFGLERFTEHFSTRLTAKTQRHEEKILIPTCFVAQKGSCPIALISENDKLNNPVKTIKRLALGVFLGAFLGATLVAGIIFTLPEDYRLDTINAEPFVSFLQLVFGHLANPPAPFLRIAGAVIGAVAGIFLARVIPNPKRWLAFLAVLVVGIIIGGTAIYRPGRNIMKKMSAVWEDNAASERASAYLQALRALDRGATNQFYITRFQTVGRTVLANYLHETEERMQNLENEEHTDFPNMDFLFTNSATYHITQKYLATHTNSLPLGNDF